MYGKTRHAAQYLWQWPQFVRGLWHLYRLKKPIVTVFGGHHADYNSHFYKIAFELGKKLADADQAVITGGGMGIMEAVLCGAVSTGKKPFGFGINVIGIDEPASSRCERTTIFLSNFSARKWLLMYYSDAYVIFPGGVGTFDELGDIMNLIKMKQIRRSPVVLVGTSFWASFSEWVDVAFTHGFIDAEFKNLFVMTDDLDEVIRLVTKQIHT
ncbi:MAG: TIGR00730 family Rossman fold protein [Candidatus Babeliales bacterium]